MLPQMRAVEIGKQRELCLLIVIGNILGPLKIQNWAALRAEKRSLIRGRQKPRAPVDRAALDPLRVAQHHESGQVLVLAPQAIRYPRTCRRQAGPRDARVHLIKSGNVIVRLGEARFDESNIFNMTGAVRGFVADPSPGLAVLVEAE